MLVCNVSLRPPRRAIAAELIEAIAATDALATGNVVFATLVDDPASVGEIVDAYLGEIMLEAASAADVVTSPMAYATTIVEAVTANELCSVAAVVPTAWNPADISTYGGSSWPTFSNGNLSLQSAAGNSQASRSTKFVTSGKVYAEFVWNNINGSPNQVGITDWATMTDGVALSGTNTIAVNCGGTIGGSAGVGSGSYGTPTVGQTVCVAVDLVNKKLWARIDNGNWNGSSSNNPAANVGGVDFSALTLISTEAYFYTMLYLSPSKVTANFGASAFAQAIPSGFTSWDAQAVAPVLGAATPHRYWRINMIASAAGAYALAEIQFRTAAGVSLPFSGGTASAADTFSGAPASNAADGNTATMYSSNNKVAPQWWAYDLGAGNSRAVVEIAITARNDSFYTQTPSAFIAEWSDDGTTWTTMTYVRAAWASAGQVQVFAV